jgi:hypothetical protein
MSTPVVEEWSSTIRPTTSTYVTASSLDDSLLLYDARTLAGFILNPTAAYVWMLCDGTRTLEDIAQHLAADFGLARVQALGDVHELANGLCEQRLLERG